jgi:hypothetical protein
MPTGVFWPILWCLVVYVFIAGLIGGEIHILGYMDDICLLAVRKFPNTVSGLMQWALHSWSNEVGLSVNPNKTEFLVFTRRRKLPCFSEPHFLGVTLS